MDHPGPAFAQAQRALLLACTAPVGSPPAAERVARSFRAVGSFEGFLEYAEQQGMAPLVRAHLSAQGLSAELPEQVRRGLSALHLRHKTVQASYAQVLGEVLEALRREGAPALLLKGAALAHHVYPEPALRPMRDADLLVSSAAIPRALHVLHELGFNEDPRSAAQVSQGHYHLPTQVKSVGPVRVHIELHTRLGIRPDRKTRLTFDELIDEAQSLSLAGLVAHTLGPEDLLWLVYRHAFGLSLRSESFRVIWIADLVHGVNAMQERIDWDKLERRYPRLRRALAWLHFVTPWPEALARRLRCDACREPAEVGVDFSGWPRVDFTGKDLRGRYELARRSFLPPAWWLHVRFGSAPGALGHAGSWVRHVVDMF